MRGGLACTALAAALVAIGSSSAGTVTPVQKAALKAVASYPEGRAEVNRAAYLARTLPSGRKEHVLVALGEVASYRGRMSAPRAASLIGMLRANDDYFAKHYAPAPKTDITDTEGLVYRYFAGRCFEFHPLANFGALNAHVAAHDADATRLLADALVARGVYASGAGVGWEYTFPFAGGRGPWISGMAQAVAAQAFARAAALVPERSTQYLRSAHAAFRAIPGRLLTSVSAGPWIRLYSFDSLRVLNAQLQAVVSLQSYATVASDPEAAALAARMQRAAAATIGRFDTGYWSYYALPHEPSPVDYHDYVVQLLKRLAPLDPRFADAATRFARYEQEPPAFRLATAGLGSLRFWLSKPATVGADTAAGRSKHLSLGAGWHTLTWPEPKKPGLYGVHVEARDYAGNTTAFETLPLARAVSAKRAEDAPLSIGVALDDPSQSAGARQAGARLARIGVTWPVGATQPEAGVVASLQQLTLPTVLELNAVPADDTARAALAQYAASLAAAVPSLRLLVLEPAATTATTEAYLATLNALRTALPTAPLGVAVDGSTDTSSTLAALAGVPVDAYVFRPAARGEWSTAGVPGVVAAIGGIPLYVDGPAPAQVRSLGCLGGIAGVLLDHLGDIRVPGVLDAQRGAIVCPGVTAHVTATVFTPPAAPRDPVQLGCDRDCLYLLALERNGKPVAVRRGTLVGGAAPATLALPKVKLPAGSYTVEARLVAQVNPGTVTSLSAAVG